MAHSDFGVSNASSDRHGDECVGTASFRLVWHPSLKDIRSQQLRSSMRTLSARAHGEPDDELASPRSQCCQQLVAVFDFCVANQVEIASNFAFPISTVILNSVTITMSNIYRDYHSPRALLRHQPELPLYLYSLK